MSGDGPQAEDCQGTVPFYVAFQIIGKYLLFINCLISNSYTISQEYDDFQESLSWQPITSVTGIS